MKITVKDFDEFWKQEGQYLGLRNTERFRNNIRKKIAKLGSTEAIDDYVKTLRTGKESTRSFIVRFYEYIGHPESDLYGKKFFDYPFERQLEIAKFLHEPKSIMDIQNRFDIDERTARQDMQALEEGITVLGSTIQIRKEKKGRKYFYRTTLHPVFLPLNLTEVYALTVYLNHVIKDDDVNAHIIRNISGRVQSQLSDYAIKKLFPGEQVSAAMNRYIDDETMAHQRESILMYLLKSENQCRFFWNEDEYTGSVRLGSSAGDFTVKLTDGSILDADLKDLEFIIDSLNYT